MHVYFIGIGGTAIGPLALLAHQAGYTISGSDKQDSQYISYLKKQGLLDINIGTDDSFITQKHAQNPIDLVIASSAVMIEGVNQQEITFAKAHNIPVAKRDTLLNKILDDTGQKLIAIAGTHGKTTTTAMAIWLFKQLNIPIGYSVGAKIPFGDMGHFDPEAKYFIYECDEFDRNFLAFQPFLSLISGIDWDHPDIYPTREEYNQAFRQFVSQSKHTYLWEPDAKTAGINASDSVSVIHFEDYPFSTLAGNVNRQNAALVAQGALSVLKLDDIKPLFDILNRFPGVSRRMEQIVPGLYSDYAHTPPKIQAALQIGREYAGDNLIVVYEGLHNTRQHFIKDELANLFNGIEHLYIVPSYLAREDESLELLTPEKLRSLIAEDQRENTIAAGLNEKLHIDIQKHLDSGNTVLCLTAGGGGSLDEWLRREFSVTKQR